MSHLIADHEWEEYQALKAAARKAPEPEAPAPEPEEPLEPFEEDAKPKRRRKET